MPGNNGIRYGSHSTALNDDRARSDSEFAAKLEKRREQSRNRTRRWREKHPDRVEQWNAYRRRIYREDPEKSARLHSSVWIPRWTGYGWTPYGWGLSRSAVVQARKEVQALREMNENAANLNAELCELHARLKNANDTDRQRIINEFCKRPSTMAERKNASDTRRAS